MSKLKNKIIVFLDIDGVMNSSKGKGPYYADMEEEKLFLLKKLIDDTNSSGIVLTSDRRYSNVYMKHFIDVLDMFNIKYLGMTRLPLDYKVDPYDNRGRQIQDYITNSKEDISSIVILDDNDDGISKLFPDEFIKINRFYGLTIDIFGEK